MQLSRRFPWRSAGALVILALGGRPTANLTAQQGWPGRDRLEPEACSPATGEGVTWLRRAETATGMNRVQGAVEFIAYEGTTQFFQSDRPYPPFIESTSTGRYTFDPVSGAERSQSLLTNGTTGRDLLRTAQSVFFVRDSALTNRSKPPPTSASRRPVAGRSRTTCR
jgi:hypothetical protein